VARAPSRANIVPNSAAPTMLATEPAASTIDWVWGLVTLSAASRNDSWTAFMNTAM
jgi:hypothetical protein